MVLVGMVILHLISVGEKTINKWWFLLRSLHKKHIPLSLENRICRLGHLFRTTMFYLWCVLYLSNNHSSCHLDIAFDLILSQFRCNFDEFSALALCNAMWEGVFGFSCHCLCSSVNSLNIDNVMFYIYCRNIEVMKQRLKDLWKDGARLCLVPGSTGELAKVRYHFYYSTYQG